MRPDRLFKEVWKLGGLALFPTKTRKERKGLGTRGGVTAAPENGERRTERPYGATGETTIHSFNFWYIADVPGVQGELLPAGAWGSAPHLPID